MVVLAPNDKVEMEDELRSRVADTSGTRIVCRTGDPSDPADLEIVRPLDARAIIVLRPEEGGDPSVVRSVLALLKADPGLVT